MRINFSPLFSAIHKDNVIPGVAITKGGINYAVAKVTPERDGRLMIRGHRVEENVLKLRAVEIFVRPNDEGIIENLDLSPKQKPFIVRTFTRPARRLRHLFG